MIPIERLLGFWDDIKKSMPKDNFREKLSEEKIELPTGFSRNVWKESVVVSYTYIVDLLAPIPRREKIVMSSEETGANPRSK